MGSSKRKSARVKKTFSQEKTCLGCKGVFTWSTAEINEADFCSTRCELGLHSKAVQHPQQRNR